MTVSGNQRPLVPPGPGIVILDTGQPVVFADPTVPPDSPEEGSTDAR